MKPKASDFAPGVVVRICEGDFIGEQAKVTRRYSRGPSGKECIVCIELVLDRMPMEISIDLVEVVEPTVAS